MRELRWEGDVKQTVLCGSDLFSGQCKETKHSRKKNVMISLLW